MARYMSKHQPLGGMTAHEDMLTLEKIAASPAQGGFGQIVYYHKFVHQTNSNIQVHVINFCFETSDLEVIEELSMLCGEEGDCLSRLASPTSSTNPGRQLLAPQPIIHARNFTCACTSRYF